MLNNNISQDTITAISTAPGVGGIAVIRISGPNAFKITDRVFKPKNNKKNVESGRAYTMLFGNLINPKTGTIIDEVVTAIFRNPHSFTGEDVVEISCHGSQYIQQEILKILIENGCRLANPGEFTQRAFVNGRMDLSQAEAVADLINAKSSAAHKIAMNQMRGGFSSKLEELREKLLHFVSLIELELDFGDHDELEFADRTELKQVAEEIKTEIEKLQKTFSKGNAIKNGIPVAIVGETNAGKSTLLNLLVGENRAIVSDIHGTTRDVIEDTVNINGIMFRFIDTAGLRQTTDVIENMGIEKTYEMIEKAQIVMWVVDTANINKNTEQLAEKIIERTKGKKLIILLNKIDKITEVEKTDINNKFSIIDAEKLEISAKKNINTEKLPEILYQCAQIPEISNTDIIISSMRHYEALTHALESIERVIEGLHTQLAADFIAQDIRECMFYLAEITGGQITTDEVLNNIFSHFCIGK